MTNKFQIRLNDPCHEDWNRMTPAEQGRFCQACSKVVTDFSIMSDKELISYLTEKNVNLCGRFTHDQLDRHLAVTKTRKFSWAYVWNIAIAAFLTIGEGYAINTRVPTTSESRIDTSKSKVGTAPEQQAKAAEETIECRIFDAATNQQLRWVTAVYEDTGKQVVPEADGRVILQRPSKPTRIVISAIGYEDAVYTIDEKTGDVVSFYLEASILDVEGNLKDTAFLLDKGLVVTVGIFISYHHVDTTEKITRKINDKLPEIVKTRDVKFYPNPVIAGTAMKMSVAIRNAGEYTIEILDESGRIMHMGKRQISSSTEIISVNTGQSWAKGVYWVRVSGNQHKKVYHGKLIIK